MPWVAPKTDFVNGDVLTATQMNNIGGDLAMFNGGTTGQVLSKASNANGDFAWTSETDPSAIPKTLIDAKGDLIAGSAADTAARLAVGTDGQVLTADSTTATGLKWSTVASGGMTLIASGSLASVSTLTISSLSQAYKDLIIDISYFNPTSSASNITMTLNSVASYEIAANDWPGGAVTNATSIRIGSNVSTDGGFADAQSVRLTLADYTRSYTSSQLVEIYGIFRNNSGAYNGGHAAIIAKGMAAVSSLVFTMGSTYQRGTIKVFGVS